jgi:hypothetical protein
VVVLGLETMGRAQVLAAILVSNPAGILGVIAGAFGILYGWKARHFRSGFTGFTTRPPEKIEPRWQDRAIVIAIAAVVLVASIVVLFSK